MDEDIRVDQESIVVTVGFQEGMFAVVRALRADERDVLLAVSPSYVGLTGAARLADLPRLAGAAAELRASTLMTWLIRRGEPGKRDCGRGLATSCRTSRTRRASACRCRCARRLLETAAREDLLLIEDNPYGTFHAGPHLPTLKALDPSRQVIYIGSFAKVGFPGARVGFTVADQRVGDADGKIALLADYLSMIKSMVTVNTSAVSQAVIAGKLLLSEFSLARANVRETATYLANMRQLLAGLESRFPATVDQARRVTWNTPTGGLLRRRDLAVRRRR